MQGPSCFFYFSDRPGRLLACIAHFWSLWNCYSWRRGRLWCIVATEVFVVCWALCSLYDVCDEFTHACISTMQTKIQQSTHTNIDDKYITYIHTYIHTYMHVEASCDELWQQRCRLCVDLCVDCIIFAMNSHMHECRVCKRKSISTHTQMLMKHTL